MLVYEMLQESRQVTRALEHMYTDDTTTNRDAVRAALMRLFVAVDCLADAGVIERFGHRAGDMLAAFDIKREMTECE